MNKNYKPGHKLTAFVLIIICLYGLMAIGGTWTPRLGLDLSGGTTVTLTARSNNTNNAGPTDTSSVTPPADTASPDDSASPGTPTPTSTGPGTANTGPTAEAMQEALSIIQQRVDSLGVGNSSIMLQGSNQIQIAVPNVDPQQLTDLVGQTAQLGFRAVKQADTGTTAPTDTSTPGETPSDSTSPSATASVEPGDDTSTPAATDTATASDTPAATDTAQRRPAPALPTAPPTLRPTEAGSNPNTSFDDLFAWQPSDQDNSDFAAWSCDMKVADGKFPDGSTVPIVNGAQSVADGTLVYPDNTPVVDVWDQPLFACDPTGSVKYLLGPVIVQGTHVTGATAGVPQGEVAYQVNLQFDSVGASQFATVTTKLVGLTQPQNQFAIVLDGKVVSAPKIDQAILGGRAQITGSFTADEAQELARVLRYGALPLTFEVSSASTVSPTLGGEQLRAGIIAGIIGLVLTLLYAMLYYRALSVIVVGSLASAAIITYSAIVLLGSTVGFALDLPGIAGAILAIGVTADSFIVYFERIRDEIRDGYSLAHSIESGWTKARGTIVVADSVQILSALVLFFLAIGSVRGFAFTLLVTTLIDLFIVFFFSKPLMTLLGRTEYFRSGNPMSGFDPDHLGVTPEALRGRRASTGTVKIKSKEA